MTNGHYTLDSSVPMPRGLTPGHVARAVESLEQRASDLVELFQEQRNAFSTVVGIFGARALASVSQFEPSPHKFRAQGAFPDLRRRGARGEPPPPDACLESKGSIRGWPVQAHYDHEGWYVIWRYLVDESLTITDLPVVVWRVDVVYLRKTDWKYETSTASVAGGGRTHTFGVKKPATKLSGAAVFRRNNVKWSGGKAIAI